MSHVEEEEPLDLSAPVPVVGRTRPRSQVINSVHLEDDDSGDEGHVVVAEDPDVQGGAGDENEEHDDQDAQADLVAVAVAGAGSGVGGGGVGVESQGRCKPQPKSVEGLVVKKKGRSDHIRDLKSNLSPHQWGNNTMRDTIAAKQDVDRLMKQMGRKEVPRPQAGMEGAVEEQAQQSACVHMAANPLRLSSLPVPQPDNDALGSARDSISAEKLWKSQQEREGDRRATDAPIPGLKPKTPPRSSVSPSVAEERVRAVLTKRRDLANTVLERLMAKRGEPMRELSLLNAYTLSTPTENKALLRSVLARASRKFEVAPKGEDEGKGDKAGGEKAGGEKAGGEANQRYSVLASASLSLLGEEPNPLDLDWIALHKLLPAQ